MLINLPDSTLHFVGWSLCLVFLTILSLEPDTQRSIFTSSMLGMQEVLNKKEGIHTIAEWISSLNLTVILLWRLKNAKASFELRLCAYQLPRFSFPSQLNLSRDNDEKQNLSSALREKRSHRKKFKRESSGKWKIKPGHFVASLNFYSIENI